MAPRDIKSWYFTPPGSSFLHKTQKSTPPPHPKQTNTHQATTMIRRTRPSQSWSAPPSLAPPVVLILLLLLLTPIPARARRGAIVRDGMNSKSAWDNPLLGRTGDVTMDPDVVAITSRCPRWTIDPLRLEEGGNDGVDGEMARVAREALGGSDVLSRPMHVTFRSKTLASAKRPNWLRATASLGGLTPADGKFPGRPLRAVWTVGAGDSGAGARRGETQSGGSSVLEDDYETCLARLYGKCVEIEVLLPPAAGGGSMGGVGGMLGLRRAADLFGMTKRRGGDGGGGPPPSVVYRVPIQAGHVNPTGMVSKCRATATLYPGGRTLANAGGGGASTAKANVDVAIPLGLTNVHLPLGPGLVDPGWAKGRKVFWKGRSVGLI